MSAASSNTHGILAMIASQASFVANDALIKLATAELPLGQSICIRGVFATLLVLAMTHAVGQLGGLGRVVRDPLVWVRSAAELGSTFLYLAALARMPIADATAIIQFAPLAIVAGAALFLAEPVGWRRWSAILVGLAGVLIIVWPGTDGVRTLPALLGNPLSLVPGNLGTWSLVAIVSVLFMVARDLVTRRIDRATPTLPITLAGSTVVTMTALALAAFESWRLPSLGSIALLGFAGLFLIGGYYFVIDAMRHGEVAVVAPFRYSVIVFALIAGWLFWREVPDAIMLTGLAIVTVAGLYTFHRERVGRRR